MTKKPTEVTLSFGALAPTLSKQLSFIKGIDKKQIKFIERLNDAIILLRIQGVMMDKEVHSARKRLITKIQKEIRKAEKW